MCLRRKARTAVPLVSSGAEAAGGLRLGFRRGRGRWARRFCDARRWPEGDLQAHAGDPVAEAAATAEVAPVVVPAVTHVAGQASPVRERPDEADASVCHEARLLAGRNRRGATHLIVNGPDSGEEVGLHGFRLPMAQAHARVEEIVGIERSAPVLVFARAAALRRELFVHGAEFDVPVRVDGFADCETATPVVAGPACGVGEDVAPERREVPTIVEIF